MVYEKHTIKSVFRMFCVRKLGKNSKVSVNYAGIHCKDIYFRGDIEDFSRIRN
jgi:hypothetical protein